VVNEANWTKMRREKTGGSIEIVRCNDDHHVHHVHGRIRARALPLRMCAFNAVDAA